MTDVTGLFNNKMEAGNALSNLLDAGFKKEDISIIVSDKARHTLFPSPTDDEGNRATRGGAAGALWGGAIGALLAGLTAVGNIVVPGSGLLVSGPLVAILSGLGTGAAIGGLSGALISAGFAVDEAKKYEEAVKKGMAVIIVHTSEENVSKARFAMGENAQKVKVA